MVSALEWAEIRALAKDGISQREIARRLGINRRTVAKALGSHRAAFLKSHGTAVVGKTIEETVISAIMLENAAMIQMIVEAAGDPAPEFSRDEVVANKRQLSAPEQFVINFDYLARKVSGRKR